MVKGINFLGEIVMDKLPRQALPLLVLYLDNQSPIEGRTKFQKIMFIIEQEVKGIDKYFSQKHSWDAYHFGPFSDSLLEDLELLNLWGLIRIKEKYFEEEDISSEYVVYEITEKGKRIVKGKILPKLPTKVIKKITEIKQKYIKMPVMEIISDVYKRYPVFAEKSKIKDKVMR